VEELMVEMHLLSVNADFSYNAIYALGVVTTFERFMQDYQPEREKDSIFSALLQAVQEDPQRYKHDAQRLESLAQSLPASELIAWLSQTRPLEQDIEFQSSLAEIADNPNFKYNRLFAIGIFSLLELSNPELAKDEKQRTEALKSIANGLRLSDDKLNKDLDLYRSNLDKMTQARVVMADILSADRKKREKRDQQSSTTVAPPATNE
jgi:photosystem II biogenesis protein Psp29